jgi:hypothetical protein
MDPTVPRRPALRGPCPGGDDDLDERGTESGQRGRGPQMTTRRGYTILGWLVWQVGSRVVKRKMGQTMAENRVKLGLAGAVLLVVGGGLAALAARSAGGSGDDE